MIALLKTLHRLFWTAIVLWLGMGVLFLISSSGPETSLVFIGLFVAPICLICFIAAPIGAALYPMMNTKH